MGDWKTQEEILDGGLTYIYSLAANGRMTEADDSHIEDACLYYVVTS